MMDNQSFLKIIARSFKVFLETGSRSNEKLKILHGAIATDLFQRLDKQFEIYSLGINDGKEWDINGRYIDKKVDITVLKNGKPVAGIGVKFVMQNYSQNSNNYFENMLGETANIRCKRIPYFQIFIIPDALPYYDRNGNIQKWETFSKHNAEKYLVLSKDNTETMIHTPTKTLLFVVHLPDIQRKVNHRDEYIATYQKKRSLPIRPTTIDYGDFGNAVIFNDYEVFMEKVVHSILAY